MRTLIITGLFAFSMASFGQQRVLLGPTDDAIPILQGKSVVKEIAKQIGKPEAALQVCPTGVQLGPPPAVTVNFGFFHGDVASMIYVTPIAGAIDSIYFMSFGSVGIPDSSAFVRIFETHVIGLGGAQHLGACPDLYDPDVGRTPYPDMATGSCNPGVYALIGDELWGSGGFSTTWHTGQTITAFATLDLGYQPWIAEGDTFIICIRLPAAHLPPSEPRTEMSGGSVQVEPRRFFKYYHHDRSTPGTFGWWGGREFDMFIWCTVRASGDLPPIIENLTVLRHTLSTDARTICVNAFDCNPGSPADTGVANAWLYYRVNGGTWDSVVFVETDSGWCAEIPGQPPGSTVEYYAAAYDMHGNRGQTPTYVYRVVDFDRDGYTTTFPTYSFVDITGGGGGTEIQPWEWIAIGPPESENDGTAGPFDVGSGGFTFFGTNLANAWVGANGGIALSANPSDTTYVRNGHFSNLDIPGADVANFFSVFWNDLRPEPSGHGSVWHRSDSNTFIVQYNQMGNFNDPTDTTTTFEIILDRTDNSIVYQYADIGTTGLDLTGLSGIQGGPPPGTGWLFLNRFGYPEETRPRNQWAVKMTYTPTGVPQREELPTEFRLYENYPNPFNPVTVIRYALPVTSRVSLKVYNMLGQQIATLVDRVQQAGRYEAQFDAKRLSSGVYLYRLVAGNYSDTRKLMLIK